MNFSSIIKLLAFAFAATECATIRKETLAWSCTKMTRLFDLSEASYKIFALDMDFNSGRRLRRQQMVDIHQDSRVFMTKIHARISHVLTDLETVDSQTGAEISRALIFMAEIIETEFNVNQILSRSSRQSEKSKKNSDLIAERAKLSLKHITESFMSISAQC